MSIATIEPGSKLAEDTEPLFRIVDISVSASANATLSNVGWITFYVECIITFVWETCDSSSDIFFCAWVRFIATVTLFYLDFLVTRTFEKQ